MRLLLPVSALIATSAALWYFGTSNNQIKPDNYETVTAAGNTLTVDQALDTAISRARANVAARPQVKPVKKVSMTRKSGGIRQAGRSAKKVPVSDAGSLAEGFPASSGTMRKTDRSLARNETVKLSSGPMSNPMDSRWIDDLSGQRVRLNMGKKSVDTSCANDRGSACERKPAPTDIRLVGAQMKTERALSDEPLDGELVRGHYLNDTPALYVK